MTSITRLAILVLFVSTAAACGSPGSPISTGPTAVGITQSLADLPPSTPNSCPSDAPLSFTVAVDGPGNGGLYKVTFEWQRTGAANTYLLETRKRRGDLVGLLPATFATLTSKEHGTLPTRYLEEGIYHFRLRGNCGPDSRWTAEVVKSLGLSPFGPQPPPEPEEPEEPEDE